MRRPSTASGWGVGGFGGRCILDEVATERFMSLQRHPGADKL